MDFSVKLPRFVPHWMLRNGHFQTLAALYQTGGAQPPECAGRHLVDVSGGDQIVLHDDCPGIWNPGDAVALMIHGLAGNHQATYMRRVAWRLNQRGIRTFRMDMRSCGAGMSLARLPYHSGRSDDALAALREIIRQCPGSPISALGFSLGGSVLLKLAGEHPRFNPPELQSVLAVCPPVDLAYCVRNLSGVFGRLYDRYFTRHLLDHVAAWRRIVPEVPDPAALRVPRRIEEFDDLFTAPVCGYGSGLDYYNRVSAHQFVEGIQIPTLVIGAEDDPLVGIESLRRLKLPGAARLHTAPGGGHMGFLANRGTDPDRSWLDWRIVEWVLQPRPRRMISHAA
jgi:predicted alpha/beta-fold hydrolase